MLIVGGDEDDERHPLAADRLDDLEAVHLRHLHVEEHELRRVILDRRDGLLAVAALPHDFDVGLAREQRGQALTRERLIVDDERLDFLHRGGPMHVGRGAGMLGCGWYADMIGVHCGLVLLLRFVTGSCLEIAAAVPVR